MIKKLKQKPMNQIKNVEGVYVSNEYIDELMDGTILYVVDFEYEEKQYKAIGTTGDNTKYEIEENE